MILVSRNDPDYIFQEYKGFLIACHKDNVAEESNNNRIIVFLPDDFPNQGYIVGLDDSKTFGQRVMTPVNIKIAEDYVDWLVQCKQTRKSI
ncbi:MAG: hypothetical protein EOP48_17880 [Sphingobacteriales bacterium]|nr:MAG: hypothetical protein EOP48_17880 [Sphingobacteriales bacterium]